MIRTLTLVFVLALVGGAAVGFFAKDALGRRPTPERVAPVHTPKIEERLARYRELYYLDDRALDVVRAANEEYDREVQAILRKRIDQLMQEIYREDEPDPRKQADRRRLEELARRLRERENEVLPEWAPERK
jgi:hypothetical protein